MQDILVPVDFSETSAAALRFATYLAEEMDLGLRVIHVFDTMISTSHTLSARAREAERTWLNERLEVFSRQNVEPVLATFRGRADALPRLRAEAVEGTAAHTILWQSTDEQTALIVLGGVGAGAGQHPPGIFGGTAQRVAMNGGCPVILIPKDYGYPRVERLAIAFDGAKDIRLLAPFARQMVHALHPEVHFVHVRHADSEWEAKVEGDSLGLAGGPGFPSYVYRFDGLPAGRVVDRLLEYSSGKDIGMLVLVRRRRGFFERLLEFGHLGRLVRRSEIPLLVIPQLPAQDPDDR